MKTIMNKAKFFLCIVGSVLFGFFVGKMGKTSPEISLEKRDIHPEISIVEFQKFVGDNLEGEISGPVRLVWGGENMREGDGIFQIPIGQIPNENDLKLQSFPYTGNAKTMKFYPSDSYFARGVEIQHRRFFQTKIEAVDAGFIPTKGVE